MKRTKFQVFPSGGFPFRRWHWRLKLANGRVIAESGADYRSKAAAGKAVASLQGVILFAGQPLPVEEATR